MERIKRKEKRTTGACQEIADIIGLDKVVRMEAFDISNISGTLSVASMVVFENGQPKKNAYRKFRLKTVSGPDDYASMKEVLSRRFTDERLDVLPDVLMMDGGKGQVNVALMVLDSLGLDIPVCGMVKDDNHRTRGLYYNNVEVEFPRGSEALMMVTALQDEAHRFAISYHRQLRAANQVHSVLDDIPGVGPARRKALVKHFKSAENVRNASIEELSSLPEIPESVARGIYEFFHKNNNREI
jgi:excinuclease ABC subunit C